MSKNFKLKKVKKRNNVLCTTTSKLTLCKRDGSKWTNQECEDINRFFDVFGSWRKMVLALTSR